MSELFLDANAHLPVCSAAMAKYIAVNNSRAGHGHAMSPSVPGREASNLIEESRNKIAKLLGAKSSNQIIFTSTCTEACEWGLYILSEISSKFNIYYSPTEHPAVKQAADKYFPNINILPIDENGVIKTNELKDCKSVICIYVQNEIGIIQPIEDIISDVLFSDMSQSPGKVEFNLSSLPIDIATFGAHKFGGPCSVGILYLKTPEYWREFGTGSRYFMDRPGTPNAAAIAATAIALEEALKTMPERLERMIEFRDILEPGIKDMGFKIVAENANRCPNTTFVHMPEKGMTTMLNLGKRKVHVGLGSACGSAYTGSSPLMTALGWGGGPHDYMRISQFGEYASKEAKLFLDQFQKCII